MYLIYSFKSYFLLLIFSLSLINSENGNCIKDKNSTILAIYEKDVSSIDAPNILGKNIFKILLNIDLIDMKLFSTFLVYSLINVCPVTPNNPCTIP